MTERTRLLLGTEAMERIRAARVLVFGLGGVGGAAAEALVRTGVGALTVIDAGTVGESNLNRQLIATRGTLGMPKTAAFKARAESINPEVKITELPVFLNAANAGEIIEDFLEETGRMWNGKGDMSGHCEERGDEAIPRNNHPALTGTPPQEGNCGIAASRSRAPRNDHDFTLRSSPDNNSTFHISHFTFYAIDAADTVTSKVAFIKACRARGLPVISCMGTGNKLDPSCLRVGDISQIAGCPLARAVRAALRKEGITGLETVYSTEKPSKTVITEHGRHAPASVMFVPVSAGMLLAQRGIQGIIESCHVDRSGDIASD